MKAICTIKENDDRDGAVIMITAEPAEYDGEKGFRLSVSNGDDVGHYKPQSLVALATAAHNMWGHWDTYVPACNGDLPWAEKAFEDHEQTARNVEEKGKSWQN